MRFLVGIILFISASLAERFMYEGYKVYDLYPKTEEQVAYLHNLMINDVHLDFWEEPNHAGKATVMIPPDYTSNFAASMEENLINAVVRTEDLSEEIKQFWEDLDQRRSQRVGAQINLDDFNTLEDINQWLQDLANGECAANGLMCELREIGTTYEGRTIYSLRVSTAAAPKPTFWLDSTIHAREWLAPATVIRVMDHLISGYGVDSEVTDLLDRYDWHFVPVFNPDGYSYTWSNERLWRKNRFPSSGSSCYGIDLNRNHDYKWGTEGVSHLPCSDIYCGTSGASELETQAVQDEILRVEAFASVVVLMTFHSYGYMWMHPWGNTINHAGQVCERADDHQDMYDLAVITANAIQSRHGTSWARGTSCEVIYETTGGTDDWAKGVAGIKYTICPELRGNNFIINRDQILPSFQEIWAGLVAQEAALS